MREPWYRFTCWKSGAASARSLGCGILAAGAGGEHIQPDADTAFPLLSASALAVAPGPAEGPAPADPHRRELAQAMLSGLILALGVD